MDTQDPLALRYEMKQEFADARHEMRQEFSNVRHEMSQEFANVRHEISDVRKDMEKGLSNVRHEIKESSDGLKIEMGNHYSRFIMWLIILMISNWAAILGVLPLIVKK
ncbi:DUF1640 domain-containing protein [Cupriavidus sp. amp6]|uniref:DUF1640 domain-containing protein n=1 Tax=Cupriavidus sp. amp6 TaxID=388051 RepID=UPI0004223EF5|nr:DUF1640 domain-containing protein [Cupriavidus sp. amp6]